MTQTDRICRIGFILFVCVLMTAGQAESVHGKQTVFFAGQKNELHVYRINGIQPGKTLLIIGGIQGDEAAGFLAADYFVDLQLEKGTLIVVPRANFPSIIKMERQINQDMNRKFTDDGISNYEAAVVEVLKSLICESHCFLNLHEGSGFYSPVDESQERNPRRFGQSVIIDDAMLKKTGPESIIDLEGMAAAVVEQINRQIQNRHYFFHVNNHRTAHPDSIHMEQRSSATFYAYNECQVPAFGIESARSLPIEDKVRHQIHAIYGFMDLLGISPKNPNIDLKTPEMKYMIIGVNGSVPVVVENMQRLKIKKGDVIRIHDIIANYGRGLSAHVIGLGNQFNDMNNEITVSESTRIVARKDFFDCGSVFIDVDLQTRDLNEDIKTGQTEDVDVLKYKFRINGVLMQVDNYGRIKVNMGDRIVIEDLIAGRVDPSKYIVNFKGFVGNQSHNTGEDRGYTIHISDKVLMKRYALDKEGKRYQVITTLDGHEVGKVFIDIHR